MQIPNVTIILDAFVNIFNTVLFQQSIFPLLSEYPGIENQYATSKIVKEKGKKKLLLTVK